MTLDRQYYQDGRHRRGGRCHRRHHRWQHPLRHHRRPPRDTKQGTDRLIWSCSQAIPGGRDDGLLLEHGQLGSRRRHGPACRSPYIDTVAQIDRKTGTLVGQYGNAPDSYAFSPSPWKFQFQHSPTITPQGTLLVSSHLPDYPDGSQPGPKQHAFEEFDIDRTNKKLTQKWIYSDGAEWAGFKG